MAYAVIYLHGFLSSPQSVKAQQTEKYVAVHHPDLDFDVPELSNYPLEAAAQIESLVHMHAGKKLRFIGSSMGGFLSTHFVEKLGGKAVLINPAVKPFELLEDYLGPHTNPYTQQNFELSEQHIDDLISLNTHEIAQPKCYRVYLQTGDETLDYRLAQGKYQGGQLVIEKGGDHSFQGFEQHLSDIFSFLLAD